MVEIDLSEKSALVTGGSRGIGAAVCRLLARAGAHLTLQYHRDARAAEMVARRCREAGVRAETWAADVADPDAVAGLFARHEEAHGGLDLLVTSAGIWRAEPLEGATASEIRETLSVNLEGTIHACREAARRIDSGCIVTIGSTAGQRGEAGHAPYAASKGAIHALTKALAVELAPGLRVNCVAPGWVDTDMTAEALADGERRAAIVSEIPLRRVATAEDIAGCVLFLASDLSRHVTGEILNVNGGSVLCG